MKRKVATVILSFILTTCFLFGYSIKKFHVIDSLFYKKNIIKTFFAFIILLVLIYILLIIIFKLFFELVIVKSSFIKI